MVGAILIVVLLIIIFLIFNSDTNKEQADQETIKQKMAEGKSDEVNMYYLQKIYEDIHFIKSLFIILILLTIILFVFFFFCN